MSPGRVCRAAAASGAPHCRPPVAVPAHEDDHEDVRDGARCDGGDGGAVKKCGEMEIHLLLTLDCLQLQQSRLSSIPESRDL